MILEPRFLATAIGSLPHTDARRACELMLGMLPDMPAWPQLPRRSFLENMYVQYSEGLPGIEIDRERESIRFETGGDFESELEEFYRSVIDGDIERFAVSEEYAEGLALMLGPDYRDGLSGRPFLKGQVTGPVSFGLTVTDAAGRASLYDERLEEIIVKGLGLKAKWQSRRLKEAAGGAETVLFFDEPYLVSVGSGLMGITNDRVVEDMKECIEGCGADLTGMHCCGNTDWSLVFRTGVDVINFDAFDYMEGFTAYHEELAVHIARGGLVAWGVVPNCDEVLESEAEVLAAEVETAFDTLEERGLDREALARQSMITPACGLGPTSVETAEKALEMNLEVSRVLNERYFQ